jgi:hypothetical protein
MIFKFRNKKNIIDNSEDLISNIKKIFESDYFLFFFSKLSKKVKIPESEIVFFFLKKVFMSFSLKKKCFDKKISTYSCFLGVFFFPLYIILVYLKRDTGKIVANNFNLIIDNISNEEEMKRFSKLESFFEEGVVYNLCQSFNYKIKNKKTIHYKKFNNYFINFQNVLQYLSFFFPILILSAKYKINFFYIYINFMDNYFYYKTFFKKNRCKYMITFQHYNTNNIKNFFINSIGGKYVIIQKNLNQLNETGFFYHSDICITFSEKFSLRTAKYSVIKKKVPMGSFFMEYYLHDTEAEKMSGYGNYDILYIGGNEQYPGGRFDISSSHASNYVEQLNWLKRLSVKFPDLKIAFKHHLNNRDKFERNFFKNSNINFIDQNLNSYFCCLKSKLILSWGSTMIIEMKSLKKNSFYLNPNNQNLQFLNELSENDNDINIESYKIFETVVNNVIYKKDNEFYKTNKKNNYYCYDSINYSENLYNFLKTYA